MFCEVKDRNHAKEKFNTRLKERIYEIFPSGITNREFALKADISPSFMNSLMNATSLPSLEVVFKLSYILAASPMHFVEGLERYIKIIGVNVKPDSDESEMEYVTKVNDMFDKFYKSKLAVEDAENKKIKLIPVENQIFIEDNTMCSFNIFEKSTLLYTRDYKKFINGHIYVIRIEGITMVRRVWKTEDGRKYILIPCSNQLDEIKEVSYDSKNIEILGIPVNVTIPIV